MKIVNREQEGVQIIELGGKVMGGPGETELSETLNGLIEQNKIHVVLEMSEVKWMDSGGLGICLGGLTRLRNRGGDLRLVGLPETVRSLMDKCRILTMFQCFDNVDEAVKSF
jgi:anti-sigma B factor antagonist